RAAHADIDEIRGRGHFDNVFLAKGAFAPEPSDPQSGGFGYGESLCGSLRRTAEQFANVTDAVADAAFREVPRLPWRVSLQLFGRFPCEQRRDLARHNRVVR